LEDCFRQRAGLGFQEALHDGWLGTDERLLSLIFLAQLAGCLVGDPGIDHGGVVHLGYGLTFLPANFSQFKLTQVILECDE
jgi:hypothetical protein